MKEINDVQVELLSALQERTKDYLNHVNQIITQVDYEELRNICEQWRQFGYHECLNKHNINEKGKTISKKTASKILPEANTNGKTRKRN